MPHTPISDHAMKLAVEALINDHEYDPSTTGDFNNESLSELIGQVKTLGYIPEDVQIITLYEMDKDGDTLDYIEVRVKVGDLLLAGDQLDPYDYTTEYTFETFGYLVANVINDVNERAERLRDELAAYKKEG